MWHFFSPFSFLAGGLCYILLAVPSYGSSHFTQEETQEQTRAAAPTPQIAASFSPESTLPHDVRMHILSFLLHQKDLLRMGAVSKNWRKAASHVWKDRALFLSNKHLTEINYKALAGGIFPRLTLNKVGLDEEGMNILATCSHLQALALWYNNLRATNSLIKLLSLSHLSHIHLGYNSIDDEGAKALAGALAQNRTLTMVNLRNNSIGDEGAKAIVGALSQNTTLTTVDLGGNTIGDEGRKALEDLKRSRPSLKLEY